MPSRPLPHLPLPLPLPLSPSSPLSSRNPSSPMPSMSTSRITSTRRISSTPYVSHSYPPHISQHMSCPCVSYMQNRCSHCSHMRRHMSCRRSSHHSHIMHASGVMSPTHGSGHALSVHPPTRTRVWYVSAVKHHANRWHSHIHRRKINSW